VSSEASEPVPVSGAPGETFGHDTLTHAGRAVSVRHWPSARPAVGNPMIVTSILFLASAGAIYLACEFFVPSYAQANATVMQALELGEFGRLDARVSVVNLFDKNYLIRDGSGIGVGAPQFGARRAIYVSLVKPF
jgi:hypothetical protein